MKGTYPSIARFITNEQSGAALPMVLLATFLLITASIAMLSAATANSRNGTDVVAETKAYYAAESGIQSAVHILRNQNVNYKDAVNNDAGTLEDWVAYTSGRVLIGGDALNAYTLKVTDPDNSQTQIAFTTDTIDTVGNASSGFSLTATTFAPKLIFPVADPVAADRTEITWVPNNQGSQLFNGNPTVTVPLGSFKIENIGNGSAITSKVYFRVNLRLVAPDSPVWVIKGSIDPTASNRIVFQSYLYSMVGSSLQLCTVTACPDTANINAQIIAYPAPNSSSATAFRVQLTPKEPQRLVVESTGYGPNGSQKKLQAIVHKSFFPLVPPAAGLLMNGPNASFDNGSGQPHYNGCDPEDPAVCVPSIGAVDSGGLTNINNASFKGPPNPNPPPAIVGEDLPDWQKTPLAMDQQISQWRNVTPSSSIIANNGTVNTGGFGDFATGKGLTFCDGNCTIHGNGGGILVVRGTLTTQGGVSFRGYIVVVGPDGMLRNGNGGPDDQIIGGVVISPYTLSPEPGHWLQPKFKVNGGGSSYIKYSSLDYLFDGGISGTTNFVSGVVEK